MKKVLVLLVLMVGFAVTAQQTVSVASAEVRIEKSENAMLEKGEVQSLQELKRVLSAMKKENNRLKQAILLHRDGCSKTNQTSHDDGFVVVNTDKVLPPEKREKRHVKVLPPPL